MASEVITDVVEVDGADLYFERRGEGPPLLLISGGGGDAGFYTPMADLLADDYTVVTYDRRGNSRSRVHDAPGRFRIAQQSADAVAVLAGVGADSAVVFGSSGGAIIGLDLAARHPDAVEALVAHEPPMIRLLPDAAEWVAFFDKLEQIRVAEGPWPALGEFMANIGRAEDSYRPTDLTERLAGNWELFLKTEAQASAHYVPNFEALVANKVPLVVAGGRESRPYFYCRTGEVVAERLGVDFLEVPGHHTGYLDEPEAFVGVLRPVLADLRGGAYPSS